MDRDVCNLSAERTWKPSPSCNDKVEIYTLLAQILFLNTVPLVEVSRAPGKMVDCGSRAGKVQDEPRTLCSAKK